MRGWLRRLFGHGERHREPPPITEEAVRDEMTVSDPEYARTRQALHDARNLQTAARVARDMARRQAQLRELDLIRETQAGEWQRGFPSD